MTSVLAKAMLAASFAACSVSSVAAGAQDFGTHPVRIIVPYSAGGIVDLMARSVSDRLAEKLGVPVTVESRSGANTALGTEAVARADPDGHTLLMTTSALVITPLMQKASYDPLKDFVGVAHMGYAVAIATVHPSIPATDLKTFIAYARANPDKINYLAPGTSSSFTLGAMLLALVNDFKITPVAYRGVPLGMPDLMAGRIHFGIIPAPLAFELIADGKLRGIAVTGDARLKKLPNLATMSEQGYASSQVTSWYAFSTSAKTPASTVKYLNAALNESLSDPAIVAKVEGMGGRVAAGWTAEKTTKLFSDEHARWNDFLTKTGLKAN